ncbi:MAG: DUF2513 domain-containing protein [Devosia sp.]
MKLDIAKLKSALIEVEDGVTGPRSEVRVSSATDFSRYYHFNQLIEAGYLQAINTSSHNGYSYIVTDLTWKGHELLKKMRNDGIWNRAKSKVSELGGEVPIRVIEKILDAGWDALPM